MDYEICLCGHDDAEHLPSGPCTGLDSYRIRCSCPSPVPWEDDPDEPDLTLRRENPHNPRG